MQLTPIQEFIKKESSSGILLMLATVLAMIAANSPLVDLYDDLFQVPVEVRIGALHIGKPMLLWINDGLMAVFFLLIGLEVKRELLEGDLSSPAKVVLPGIAAVGGMLVPALFYVALNISDTTALNGWAIPAATDIAFALGIMALLGDRVPPSLKIFLMALAIMDDLGAIIIIALFYSGDLSIGMLVGAAICLAILIALNFSGVEKLPAYLLVGAILWICVLKSGVHATLAGVALAFAIPLRSRRSPEHSLLHQLEHSLHPWVAFAILPIFAFANAGIPLADMSFSDLFQPVPLGIILGLLVGKQVGVFGFSWAAIQFGLASPPEGSTLRQLYGVAALCGIGFTMSLFIGGLAFEHTGGSEAHILSHRLGILSGSLIAGVIGYLILKTAPAAETLTGADQTEKEG